MRCGVIENSIDVKHVINRLRTCRGCLLEAGNNACVSEDVAHIVCLSDTHRLTFWARASVCVRGCALLPTFEAQKARSNRLKCKPRKGEIVVAMRVWVTTVHRPAAQLY
jgi:hypothetical protein